MVDFQLEKVRKVKGIISDVDGILTDGSIYIGPDHYELKRFTVEDGVGTALARQAGFPVALISGRHSEATTVRAAQMKIEDVYQGYLNKVEPLEIVLKKWNLTAEEVVYIGDGLIDIPVLERVGVPVSVPHAPQIVKDLAMYITARHGGQGVLREVMEWLLTSQERFTDVLETMRRQVYKVN